MRFIHPPNSYSLNINYIPGTVVSAGGIVLNKTDRIPATVSILLSSEENVINKSSSSENKGGKIKEEGVGIENDVGWLGKVPWRKSKAKEQVV